MSDLVDQGYRFKPHEQPTFPGSPYAPEHPALRRAGYVVKGLLMALTGTLGNAVVSANISPLAGALGLDVADAALLPAVFVAANASANLLLIKLRMQYGIPATTVALLVAYILSTLLQLAVPSFSTAIVVRAVHGMAAAGLSTLTLYNFLQVFPAKSRPAALILGISLPQLATPIARMIPVELVAFGDWQALHLIELGVALAACASMLALPLPPSDRVRALEPLDFLTIALLAPAITLLCAVLGTGRYHWWTDTPWLGGALVAAVPLLAAAILIELHRKSPLLQVEWYGTATIFRFAVVAMLVRVALAEQTYGAVGLLTAGGLTSDQLHILFGFVALAMLLGIGVVLLTLRPDRLRHIVIAAALVIALGAWMDGHATNITRPEQLYLSQALIGFGTILFIGPSLVFGFLRMMEKGPNHLVSFIVLFSMTQNIGGLAGSALLGTYQVARTRAHAAALSEHLLGSDPQVIARIQAGTGSIAGAIVDPGARAAQGAGLLAQAMTREATILAFDDVFRFVAALALLTAAYLVYVDIVVRRREKRLQKAERGP